MSLGKAASGFSDEVFPDGTVVKKGTKVVYAIFSTGRMESVWGRDCREYKPERWLRDVGFMSESAYKFSTAAMWRSPRTTRWCGRWR